MSKNITTTTAALTKQGVSEGTVTTAVSGITRGMGTVGTNTTKQVEDHIKKEDVKMKLFVKLIFVVNFLFLGGGFLIAFSQFIAYNGLVIFLNM